MTLAHRQARSLLPGKLDENSVFAPPGFYLPV